MSLGVDIRSFPLYQHPYDANKYMQAAVALSARSAVLAAAKEERSRVLKSGASACWCGSKGCHKGVLFH